MSFSVRSTLTATIFMVASASPVLAQEADLEGRWTGTLQAGPTALNLVLSVQEIDEGYDSVMISVDQGNAEIAIDSVSETEGQYSIVMSSVGARYVARLEDDELDGTFYQNGMSLPLSMTKASDTE